jgi:DNA-binding NtrC family response regulator
MATMESARRPERSQNSSPIARFALSTPPLCFGWPAAGRLAECQARRRLPRNLQTKTLRQIEREVIFRTLKKANGNKMLASKELEISIRTLHYKLSSYEEVA